MIAESRGGQDPLVGDEIHRREVHQLLALAGDGHGLDDDVDLVVLQRGDPVGRRQDAVLDLRRGAEDVAGHLAGDVDVESGDLPGDRVAEAEQVAADVEADDQPAAGRMLATARSACAGRGTAAGSRCRSQSSSALSGGARHSGREFLHARRRRAAQRKARRRRHRSARPQPASTVTTGDRDAQQSVCHHGPALFFAQALIIGTRSFVATAPAPPRSPRSRDSTAPRRSRRTAPAGR